MRKNVIFKKLLQVIIPLLFSFVVNAQLCTGSLGDPVVNITFGNGSSTNTGFPPPSAYTYTNSTCPNDGFYTITTATSGCFGSTWHTVTADHTGGGAFMLVNASYQPGDFLVTTVTGLCPNTTYEFAAWVLNILVSASGIKPDLTFTVETTTGVILNQFNTGGISVSSQPVWKQYGFFFTTSLGNSSVVLRITNNAPGGTGNDLALDDITFRPCGPAILSSIQGYNDIVNICKDEQLTYNFDGLLSSGFFNPAYQWQVSVDSGKSWSDITGATMPAYIRNPTNAGNFSYRLTVAETGNTGIPGCWVSSNIVTVNVHPKPIVNAGPDRILIKGNTTFLSGSVNDPSSVYNWSPPDYLDNPAVLDPIASPLTDMVYKLSAVSKDGCSNEDDVLVKVVEGIFVPTAFTPNKDGKNDYWRIPFLDPQFGATVSVYNRLGILVYYATGVMVNWDGTYKGMAQPSGTYVYIISFKKGIAFMKGTLTLIR